MLKNRRLLPALCALLVLALLITGCTGKLTPVVPSASSPDLSPEPTAETAPTDAPPEETPQPDGKNVVRVGSVDEFIEAIASDTEIFLEPGVYDVSAYGDRLYKEGRSSGYLNDYVFFDLYNGYSQLTVCNVSGLTISAEGAYNTRIVTPHVAADVICFENCSGVVIEGVTLGHSPEQGSCSGDVLEFGYCSDIALKALDLYGCGAYALTSFHSSNISVSDSTLRDCSYGAISVYDSSPLVFDDCDIKNCREFDILNVYYSNLRFDGCRFDGNSGRGFIPGDNASLLEFCSCSFGPWETAQISSLGAEASLMFDEGCFFDGSYVPSGTVVDSVEQLAEAVAPGARIVLLSGRYNISDWLEALDGDEVLQWNDSHSYTEIRDCFDGRYFVIKNADGLSLSGGSGERGDTVVEIDPRYADVLSFENCSGVTVSDITLGHTVGGECSGCVVNLSGCTGAIFDNVDLYGCGTEGVYGYRSGNVFMYGSFVHDCTYSGLSFEGASGYLVFHDSVFTGNGSGLSFYDCGEAEIGFYRCTFGQQESNSLYWHDEIMTSDCSWSEITAYPDYSEEYYGEDEDYPEQLRFDAEFIRATVWNGGWSQYFGAFNGSDPPSCTLSFGSSDTGTLSGYYEEKADFGWSCSSGGYYAELSLPQAEYASFEIYAAVTDELMLRLEIDGEVMWFVKG